MFPMSIMLPVGRHYCPLSLEITCTWQLQKKKKHCCIIHLIPSCFSIILAFSVFSFFPPLSLIMCLSRASIVQKRIIYFQDEGSLTVRLCEKGKRGCLSSFQPHPGIITGPLSAVPLYPPPCFFFFFFFFFLKVAASIMAKV